MIIHDIYTGLRIWVDLARSGLGRFVQIQIRVEVARSGSGSKLEKNLDPDPGFW